MCWYFLFSTIDLFGLSLCLDSEKSDSERSSASPRKNKKSLIDDSSEDEVEEICICLWINRIVPAVNQDFDQS